MTKFIVKWSEYSTYEAQVEAKSEAEARKLWEQGDPKVWQAAEIADGEYVVDSLEVAEATEDDKAS